MWWRKADGRKYLSVGKAGGSCIWRYWEGGWDREGCVEQVELDQMEEKWMGRLKVG